MDHEYQEGWFCNKEQLSELNVQLDGDTVFMTEFLPNEVIKKHVYDVKDTSARAITDIFDRYESYGRLS